MKRRTRPLALLATLAMVAIPALTGAASFVVEGTDHARLLVPQSAPVASYENDGYRMTVRDGVAEISVDVAPIASVATFALPSRRSTGRVDLLARSLAATARSRYDAVTQILGWEAANVRYRLDRDESQEPGAVLERRTAYCTGFARLAVALLRAVDIPAREVAGYVAEDLPTGPRSGFHRWVEVEYPDRGWVFSDPLASLHFVSAAYLRLSEEWLHAETPGPALVLERTNGLRPDDVFPGLATATNLPVRANGASRLAAALYVELPSAEAGEAVLEGSGVRRTLQLVDGRGTFLGLEPGRYDFVVRSESGFSVRRALTFRGRVRGEMILLPDGESTSRAGGR